MDYPGKAPTTPVTLWGDGSLGKAPAVADVVTDSKVTLASSRGAFAWAVMDEGVKARINTPFVDAANSNGMKTTDALSDPRWESLHQFARIYQDKTRLTTSGGVPVLKARGPTTTWRASTGSDPTTGVQGAAVRTPSPGVVLMPEIAKVQIVFSLLT